jgi:hypothetical protein
MGMVTKAVSSVAKSGLNAGDVMNGIFAVSDYKDARQQGDGVVKSAVKAGASFAWGEFFYGGMSSAISGGLTKVGLGALSMPVTMGVMLAPAVAQIGQASMEQNGKVRANHYKQKGKLGSGYFDMSQSGYTMRQRSLNAIHSNGLNTQSVLGNEARTYFRS